jgi:hypothetical protein
MMRPHLDRFRRSLDPATAQYIGALFGRCPFPDVAALKPAPAKPLAEDVQALGISAELFEDMMSSAVPGNAVLPSLDAAGAIDNVLEDNAGLILSLQLHQS